MEGGNGGVYIGILPVNIKDIICRSPHFAILFESSIYSFAVLAIIFIHSIKILIFI